MQARVFAAIFLGCVLALTALSCNGGGDSREASVGHAFKGGSDARPGGNGGSTGGTDSGDPGNTGGTDGTGGADGTGGDGISTGNSSGGSSPNSRTLEQCTAEKKAWRGVVDGGKQPSDCIEELVDWCCTREEVLARFPTMKTPIENEFATILDAEKHVLYHCSYDAAAKRYTFHAAKIDAQGQTSYKWVYVTEVFPVDTGSSNNSCVPKTTDDLRVN